MSYIYKIINNVNGKLYVGKTMKSVESRFQSHYNEHTANRSKNRPLYRAMNKHGFENFSIEILEECDEKQSCNREKYWIEKLSSFKYGYNATTGGDGKSYIDHDLVINNYNKIGNMSKVAKIMGIHRDSVLNILNNNDIDIIPSTTINQINLSKMVNMYGIGGKFIMSFVSTKSAAQYMIDNSLTNCKLYTIRQHISEVCKGRRKTAAKFKWSYE